MGGYIGWCIYRVLEKWVKGQDRKVQTKGNRQKDADIGGGYVPSVKRAGTGGQIGSSS